MSFSAEELAYRSRALAQAHPLTVLAKRYVDRAVAEQRTSQPLPEIGIWAGAGLIGGYCLRRVEESDAGLDPVPPGRVSKDRPSDERSGDERPGEPDQAEELADLDRAAVDIAADLRSDSAGRWLLGEDARTVEALDRLIASEVSRRLDHWRETIDDSVWAELEEYLTWWVVKGYALRVAETASWAGAAS